MLVPILILAGLLGWVFIRHKTTGTSFTGAATDTPAEFVRVGGTDLVTKLSGYDQAALANSTNVPNAYDINDPVTAQRRLDAINRGIKVDAIAASQGMTADQLYQQHLAQSVDATRDDPAAGGFDWLATQKSVAAVESQGFTHSEAQLLVASPESRSGRGHL